jgi:hypothetical protein
MILTIEPSLELLLPAPIVKCPAEPTALSPVIISIEPDDDDEDPLVTETRPLETSSVRDDPTDPTLT